MTEVTMLLEDARARIAEPERWTQGVSARDADGKGAPALAAFAVCWCALGSLSKSVRELRATEYAYALTLEELGVSSNRLYGYETTVSDVNDDHGHEATLRMFDDAIERSKMG